MRVLGFIVGLLALVSQTKADVMTIRIENARMGNALVYIGGWEQPEQISNYQCFYDFDPPRLSATFNNQPIAVDVNLPFERTSQPYRNTQVKIETSNDYGPTIQCDTIGWNGQSYFFPNVGDIPMWVKQYPNIIENWTLSDLVAGGRHYIGRFPRSQQVVRLSNGSTQSVSRLESNEVWIKAFNVRPSNDGNWTIETRWRGDIEVVVAPASYFAPSADFNKDGQVSPQDLFSFLDAYFMSDIIADCDDSSTVSVEDLFAYLELFFN